MLLRGHHTTSCRAHTHTTYTTPFTITSSIPVGAVGALRDLTHRAALVRRAPTFPQPKKPQPKVDTALLRAPSITSKSARVPTKLHRIPSSSSPIKHFSPSFPLLPAPSATMPSPTALPAAAPAPPAVTPPSADFVAFVTSMTAALEAGTSQAAQFPDKSDLMFHRTLDRKFAKGIDASGERVLKLADRLLQLTVESQPKSKNPGRAKPRRKLADEDDVVDSFQTAVVDQIDHLLEDADIHLDEVNGKRKKAAIELKPSARAMVNVSPYPFLTDISCLDPPRTTPGSPRSSASTAEWPNPSSCSRTLSTIRPTLGGHLLSRRKPTPWFL